MKAGLAAKEPEILARWERLRLYERLQERDAGGKQFLLHDGPPYANGRIHIGTAFNKILKDITLRSKRLLGYRAPYVPGWDCHGLPIEWKIEEEYRAKGQTRDQVDKNTFRARCRQFAADWMAVQKSDFQRLGVLGAWEHAYSTMDFTSEAKIVAEIYRFLNNGGLYRGFKPVMWSVVEKTALAEAEVEYHDRDSTAVYVAFPVITAAHEILAGAKLVIWTTTPWTLPANRAIAYHPELTYALVQTTGGDRLVMARDLVATVLETAGVTGDIVAEIPGTMLAGVVCHHPLRADGYMVDVPALPAEHVTAEAGTGLVHTAPSHGLEDFAVGQAFGLEVPTLVGEDGIYTAATPKFAGVHIFKIDALMLEALQSAGALVGHHKVTHSYPHSWRSKAPLIYRATPQWFISMQTNDLRQKALDAIKQVKWLPAQGENRIRSMVESRPDWCISRQRAWGVPIAVFVHKQTGEILRDDAVYQRVIDAMTAEGADAWFTSPATRFLGDAYTAQDYEQVTDIVDVWFESGTTHAFVLEESTDLGWPADLYLEGSDQHRGWFQSSLLHSCGTRGQAPYRAVLTHGYVLDGNGRKMSKSLGNVVAPAEIIEKYGADVLRLWVAMSDVQDDLRIGPEIIKFQEDIYRRFRNTLRYLLGNLDGFDLAQEGVTINEMPELERWVMHRLAEMIQLAHTAFEAYDLHGFYSALHTFCAVDLSAFYFDIRKDSLYCDAATSGTRRAVRTVLHHVLETLTKLLAPVLCFTAEEAWLCYHPSEDDSVHLQTLPSADLSWLNPSLAQRWQQLRDSRRVVNGALEIARAQKLIGSSLQARVELYLTPETSVDYDDWAQLTITSEVVHYRAEPAPESAYRLEDVPGVAVVVTPAQGEKCPRCWHIVAEIPAQPVCHRCAEVVAIS
jgi:isoleucyl-tRNA synthetase